jgi:hypothetical protein
VRVARSDKGPVGVRHAATPGPRRSRRAVAPKPLSVLRGTTLSPVSPVAGAGWTPAPEAPGAQLAGTAPSGGDPSNDALGLMALLAAGGVAVLRARQLASAAGLDDIGTLTALGHSAFTFWAGSCVSLGTRTTAGAASAALAPSEMSAPGAVLGSRAQFAVEGELSAPFAAAGGRSRSAASLLEHAAARDRTGLVAALLAASAVIGGAFGVLAARREADMA